MQRRFGLVVLCAALSTAVPMLAGCSGGTPSKIGLATVGRATVTEVVEAAGAVEPRASVTVSAPADGTVAALGVRPGQRVNAGVVLLRIDSPTAQQRLAQAQQAAAQATSATPTTASFDTSAVQAQLDAAAAAAFTAARAAATAIPDTATRKRAITAIDAAQRRYAAAAAQAAAASARLSAGIGSLGSALASLGAAQRVQAQAAVSLARQTVDALVVRSPIRGIVSIGGGAASSTGSAASSLLSSLPSSVQGEAAQALGGSGGAAPASDTVAVGMPVQAGATLVTVTDVSTLSLVADVDETDVLQVRPGVIATVQLDAVPDATYRATVASVDVTPGQSSRGGVSYRVHLALGGGTLPDGSAAPRPRPGMSAVADLQVRRATDVVSVPASAVVRDGSQATVWVDESGRAHRRVVTLGAQGDAVVQVVSGVREGDRVVVHGADGVREGQRLPR